MLREKPILTPPPVQRKVHYLLASAEAGSVTGVALVEAAEEIGSLAEPLFIARTCPA